MIMNETLQKALRTAYPKSMSVGITCGDGWFLILWELGHALEELGVEAAQIKEKFGTLRYYATDYSDELDGICAIIDEATERSAVTCEACGRPGTKRGGSWIRTLCNGCAGEVQDA